MGEVEYPAVFPFRVIGDAGVGLRESLERLLESYEVVKPLEESNHSRSGKYCAYGVSLRMQSREQQQEFQDAVYQVVGIRMLL